MEIKNLQVVRGVAAILVVVTHFFGADLSRISPYFGHMGVDIFFTLSGFLMVYSQNESKGAIKFFTGRVKRIYPAYLILSIPLIILAIGTAKPYALVANLFLLPGFNDPQYTIINYPAWTLVYEMIFYVLFAAALLISKKRTTSCIITVIAIICSVNIFSGAYEKQGWVNLGYILGDQLMLNFAAGCMIGLMYSELKIRKVINFYVFIMLFAVMLYLGLCVINDIRIIKLGIPSFVIIIIAVFSKPANSRMYNFLYTIGGASYSIYLSHIYFAKYSKDIAINYNVGAGYFYPILFAGLFLSLLFGLFFYSKIERPLGEWFKKKKNIKNEVISECGAEYEVNKKQ
ncbi:acyltransferase [Morganella sp. GD04133]|uniref:acyltransferase family protein n=1 Tax=Morganella sp. GD04133 TaxID=2975435 RepID=UPI00244D392A|nr:acyltransferase [Morganella sp. GD04133]MDH0356606.1 acyltransferase [Morganella sp. GD04133]